MTQGGKKNNSLGNLNLTCFQAAWIPSEQYWLFVKISANDLNKRRLVSFKTYFTDFMDENISLSSFNCRNLFNPFVTTTENTL